MTKKKTAVPAGISPGDSCECTVNGVYSMEALLSVDERGQMVLPKDFREKNGIRPGDKLALFSFEKEGGFCCMALVKAENLSTMMTTLLGPLGGEVTKK
ncbi:HgcAB-associated protein HgcC [Methanoregula sp.]|uniref:HgcAB-associated protein HgcC n=1 Tax=Methanoregula sp. TaxID=2052170 RepID=UPI003C711F7E